MKVSEIFYSAQGEGRFIGVPSVFLRMFGCNFQCRGFGMPKGELSIEADEIAKSVNLYSKYEDLPLSNTGCDSYPSWHPKFKHLSPTYTVDEVADKLIGLLPNKSNWIQSNGNDVHLVITGGESLLKGWQKIYPELLKHNKMYDLLNLTFETNGTQPITKEFEKVLRRWNGHSSRELTFSVSAKLSPSGEKWEDAIRPDVVAQYEKIGTTYLKFVVEAPQDFDEVDRAVSEYRNAGFKGLVYVMAVGGVVDVYNNNKFNVADEAMKRGYYYSPRLHIDIFGNAWGT